MNKITIALMFFLVIAGVFVASAELSERIGTDREKYESRSACGDDDDCKKGDSIPATIELREPIECLDNGRGGFYLPEGTAISVLFYDEQ